MTIDVRDLPFERVRPNPTQPRQHFDEAALQELAASIESEGLLQPIVVRPMPDDTFQIVMGERRWRAHGLLARPTIRAIVQPMTDDEVSDRAIVENLQRKDISPLEEARAFQRRLDAGVSVEELARRLGLRQSWRITERTALLRLDPPYQEALARGILTPSQATEMARHPVVDQHALFDAIGAGRCPSYAELRAVSRRLLEQRAQGDLFAGEAVRPAERRQGERQVEQLIGSLARLLRLSFDGPEVTLRRDVRPRRAEHLALELGVIERQVAILRRHLEEHAKGDERAHKKQA